MGIFPFDAIVFPGSSDAEVRRTLDGYEGMTQADHELVELASPTAGGRAALLSGNQLVIRTRHVPEPGDPELAHEVFHAVHFLMENVGVRLSDDSDEVYAYGIQHLTEQINRRLKPLPKSRKPGRVRA